VVVIPTRKQGNIISIKVKKERRVVRVVRPEKTKNITEKTGPTGLILIVTARTPGLKF
jgi:hypothetical protein